MHITGMAVQEDVHRMNVLKWIMSDVVAFPQATEWCNPGTTSDVVQQVTLAPDCREQKFNSSVS
jgi:hypothetical protein